MLKNYLISAVLLSAGISCLGQVVYTNPPPSMTIALTSDGGSTYEPMTGASGQGQVWTNPPPPFVPVCTSDGGETYSQCSFSGGITQIIGPVSTVTGAVSILGAGVTQSGSTFTIASGAGGCAIGTCIQNAGSASQTITQATGTILTTQETDASDGNNILDRDYFYTTAAGQNNGQSFNGGSQWVTKTNHSINEMCAHAGICQWTGGPLTHTAAGDTAFLYGYMTSYGQSSNANDESNTYQVGHSNQLGSFYGPVTSATSGANGTTLLTVTGPSCNSGGSNGCSQLAYDSAQFPVSGWMFDSSQGIGPLTIGAFNGVVDAALEYTLSSGRVTASTAIGTVSSCTSTLQGKIGVYGTQTCTITIISGSFASGKVFHLGSFPEEDVMTCTSCSGSSQTMTLQSQWPFYGGDLVTQGGPAGEVLVATGASFPIAFPVAGAVDSTHLLFGNCVKGSCTSLTGIIQPPNTSTTKPVLTRASNVVTASPNPFNIPNLTAFTVGTVITVSGYTPSDLNGTFTVVSNSMDNFNPSITWAQTGANETSSAEGNLTLPSPQITLYPAAMICGTNNGTIGDANLCTNHATWTTGDTAIGASASEFTNAGLNLYLGQVTASNGSYPSLGIFIDDQGPSQLIQAISVENSTNNGVASAMMNINGSYNCIFCMNYRPGNNGTLLYVQGNEPVSSNAKPYYIFQDDGSSGGKLEFNPYNSQFTFSGAIVDPQGVVATSIASQFATGTTINGILPCLQNGTDCPSTKGFLSGLSAGTASISTTAACTPSATCVYKLTNCGPSGTIGVLTVGAVTVGSSFVINSMTSSDTEAADGSAVCWEIN